MTAEDEFLKRPLYVYDLPKSLLSSLSLKGDAQQSTTEDVATATAATRTAQAPQADNSNDSDVIPNATSCGLCGIISQTVADQRAHAKSDYHRFNLKRKVRGDRAVSEAEFERMLEELSESISGSDSDPDSSGDDARNYPLATLFRRKAAISSTESRGHEPHRPVRQGAGKAPLVWFTSSLLPPEISLGVYRAIFSEIEQQDSDYLSALCLKQFASNFKDRSPHVFLCMIGGGHFAGSIVSLVPKVGKRVRVNVNERQAVVLEHKTFHRYTTRRKQGGAQSANDNAKGNAHSAGSSLRRYNEAALNAEVRELLASWKDLLETAELLFIRATGTSNRRTLFGYEGAPLRSNDPRIRGFPFSTRRATQSELMRCFVELTRVKISRIDEAALAALSTPQKAQQKPTSPPAARLNKEEEAALLHTSQLAALIRRSKAPALLSYLTSNNLPADYRLFPPSQHHHSPTPLHLAASLNSPAMVLALLTKADADPGITNADAKTAFELAGDRPTRDAFRIARTLLGEQKWKWDDARVPPGLTRAQAEARDKREKDDEEKGERERRQKEMQKIKDEEREKGAAKAKTAGSVTTLSGAAVQMGMDRQQMETGGLSAEARVRLERERRARAAEERVRRMQGR